MEKAVERRDAKLQGDLCNNYQGLHNHMTESLGVETPFKKTFDFQQHDCLHKLLYIHTVEYCVAIKRSNIFVHCYRVIFKIP